MNEDRHTPNYFKNKTPSKRGSDKEQEAIKQINSGRVWFSKGDLIVKTTDENYFVDVKDATKQKCFQFSLKDIKKIWKDSGERTPMFLVYIKDFVVKASIQRVK